MNPWDHALQDLNVELLKGQSLLVVGQSGCGKSSILRGHCRCPTVDAPPMCMPVPTQCDTADTPKLFLAVLGYRPALTGNPAHQV